MDAAREFVDVGSLASEIEDADLWVGHTTVEARLRVWLDTDISLALVHFVVVPLYVARRRHLMIHTLFLQ